MVDHLRATYPVARKDHRCSLCTAVIEKGAQHACTTCLYGDRAYNFRECAECDTDGIVAEVHAWAGSPDEGVGVEEAHEWAHEHRGDKKRGAVAASFLKRSGCGCEVCAP